MLALERHLALHNEHCGGGVEAVFHDDEVRLYDVKSNKLGSMRTVVPGCPIFGNGPSFRTGVAKISDPGDPSKQDPNRAE